MNSFKKSSIILLFAIALLTGFMSVVYKQTANAFSINLWANSWNGWTTRIRPYKSQYRR